MWLVLLMIPILQMKKTPSKWLNALHSKQWSQNSNHDSQFLELVKFLSYKVHYRIIYQLKVEFVTEEMAGN